MILGYCRITVTVAAVYDRREWLPGIRRNPGEINDHPVPERFRGWTEFGLPPSNMKGAFGNGGALRFSRN
jgi:hypothetical protein